LGELTLIQEEVL